MRRLVASEFFCLNKLFGVLEGNASNQHCQQETLLNQSKLSVLHAGPGLVALAAMHASASASRVFAFVPEFF